jgi:hypothetical protein
MSRLGACFGVLDSRSLRVSLVSTLLITASLNLHLNDSGTPRSGFGPAPGADLVPARSRQRPATPLRLPLPASPNSRLLSSEVPGLVAGQLCGTCGTAPCLGLGEELGTEEAVSYGLWLCFLSSSGRSSHSGGWVVVLGRRLLFLSPTSAKSHIASDRRRHALLVLQSPVPATSQQTAERSFNVPEFSRQPWSERDHRPPGINRDTPSTDHSLTFRHTHSAALALWLGFNVVDGTERLYFGRSLIAVHMTHVIPQPFPLNDGWAVTRLHVSGSNVTFDCRAPLQAIPVSQTDITRLTGDRRGVGLAPLA